MTRWIVSAVALLVLAGGWLVMNLAAPAEEAPAPHPHEYSPVVAIDLTAEVAGAGGDRLVPWEVLRRDFSGTSRDGAEIDLEDVVRGNRVTLLTYFAEWCANCRYEAPDLVAKYGAHREDGLMIIGAANTPTRTWWPSTSTSSASSIRSSWEAPIRTPTTRIWCAPRPRTSACARRSSIRASGVRPLTSWWWMETPPGLRS